jgi:hypothetical protein
VIKGCRKQQIEKACPMQKELQMLPIKQLAINLKSKNLYK